MPIRPAVADDIPTLRVIERLAGERFRDVGRPQIADDEPPSPASLSGYTRDHRALVALDDARLPVGYVLIDLLDGNAHVEQISVRPDHQGVGVGRALLAGVAAWAAERGALALTLTTFSQVPWNAPLFQHLGFRVLVEGEIGPELRMRRDREAARGMDPAARVCMRLDLASPSTRPVADGAGPGG